MRLLLAPQRRVPLVLLRLILPAGAENDSADSAGLAALTAALLDEGTKSRTSFEIAAAAERLGGYLTTGAGWNSASAEVSLLAHDLPVGIELLADVAIRPTFPEHEVGRLKEQTIGQIRRRRMQPAIAARETFDKALYGTMPYARPLTGSEDSVRQITRDQIVDLFRLRVVPGGATLVAVGDIDADSCTQVIESVFGEWHGRAPAPQPMISPQTATGPRVVLVDRPEAPQSEICIGHAGLPRKDPDFLTFSVLNTLLGGKFTSRINLNLRERHGFTYGAHSQISARRGPGPFVVTAAVDNESVVAAVREVLHEIGRLREERVTGSELRETVDYMIGSFPYSCETLGGVAARLGNIAIHDLPDDYYRSLPEALRAISATSLQRCARAHLHPESALVVVAGPAGEIAGPIEKIAPPELAGSC
jgi:zinc protease